MVVRRFNDYPPIDSMTIMPQPVPGNSGVVQISQPAGPFVHHLGSCRVTMRYNKRIGYGRALIVTTPQGGLSIVGTKLGRLAGSSGGRG